MDERRCAIHERILDLDMTVTASVFVDTKRGAILTDEPELEAARGNSEKASEKNRLVELNARRKTLSKAQNEREFRSNISRYEAERCSVSVQLENMRIV